MRKPHAIVVGFGPGNGLGIASAFGSAGFCLSLVARDPDSLKDEILGLAQAGYIVTTHSADAHDHSLLTLAVQSATDRLGPPEVLIYNVATCSPGKPSHLTPAQLGSDLEVNVSGALACVNAVLPSMLKRKSGAILFTGGGWALRPALDFASVSLGKSALRVLALLLAEELEGSGVRVGILHVMGAVRRGTRFDPAKIGKAFLDMYQQPKNAFIPEVQFNGS